MGGGKRTKQYRKLMVQYGLNFGFREPYQVLVDANMIRDADRFKMDLLSLLEKTLHGQVKIMITQCSIRHLYAAKDEPGVSYLIDKAKTYERRRCGHRPEDHAEPLSTQECIGSVIDPKGHKSNKHRYVVASQDLSLRRELRNILGVPLIYINRSVMIMEPMAETSVGNREREERGKFRDGLKRANGSLKRKRDEEGDDAPDADVKGTTKKAKKRKGPKEPNPLSVKKKKPKAQAVAAKAGSEESKDSKADSSVGGGSPPVQGSEDTSKRKRKRKHKSITGNVEATHVAEVADEDS
ncbi:Fcf1-domain-containing protein [Bisporella sp. PMI_857]|nr:Fcf1-domain-containing protein [Bisporella sp. PMI_857]